MTDEMTAPAFLAGATEKQFQSAVVDLAHIYGWMTVHIPNAIMNPILPDLILIREGVVLWLELKTERGRLGPKQAEMIERLRSHGADVRVVRPSDWVAIERTLER